MTVTAEFVLRSSSLPLVSVTTDLPPDEITCRHALCLQPDVRTFVVEVDPTGGVSESNLESLDEIEAATALGETDDRAVFEVDVDLADTPFASLDDGRSGVAKMKSTTVTPDGWRETKVFKDHQTFEEFRATMADNGIPLDLVSITPNAPEDEDFLRNGLTERQREALSLAVSRGYYESPRQVTAAELAAELDISQPSLSALLRRGEREVLTASLDDPPT
ncbi:MULTISPECIES: helix-turn-helix domain-containing protein [Halobacterium]|uniref:helix-turn-helix domain-containing protein n=1 Tax=Halobacterium TaxID=2239 RepID=UPI00073E8B40|nr:MULTISPECIES: helix-turn-helix domain-containing protein [Halobacterium]MCG1003622.1 helix-turn-helix domain-containing protein [Halobacterium noricense]